MDLDNERKIQRSICEINQSTWRIKSISEIFDSDKMYQVCKRWAGHVTRIDDDRAAKKVLGKKGDGTRAKAMPRKMWIERVEKDRQDLGVCLIRCMLLMIVRDGELGWMVLGLK